MKNNRRMEMHFLLDEMFELERTVRAGMKAREELGSTEKHFKELCKAELEVVQDERN